MKLRLMILSLLLILVCIPRFGMWDPGPIARLTATAKASPWGHPGDVEGYERLVTYFRGQMPADSMLAPFSFRPLAPAFAAIIPARADVAINLLNLLSLFLVLVLMERIGDQLNYGSAARWASGLLLVCSFPTFYYGTIGFIDPVVLMFTTFFLWVALRGISLGRLVVVTGLAVLVKETTLAFVLLPLVAQQRAHQSGLGFIRRLAMLGLVGVTTSIVWRVVTHFPGQDYFWTPDWKIALENFSRPRTWVSLALTLGLPALMAGFALLSGRAQQVFSRQQLQLFATGAALSAVLYLYAALSAHTDGRIIWNIQPFLLPLATSVFVRRRVPSLESHAVSAPFAM